MPVEVEGVLEARSALKKYAPFLAKETQKEIAKLLRGITNKARGYVPAESPLSGWANEVGEWQYRAFDRASMVKGIGFSTAPTKPNKRGFVSLATIYNKSAAGSIYETAGRKHPQGQPPAKRVNAYKDGRYFKVWESGKEINSSANPYAGKQFIDALPPLVDSQQSGASGRRTRKTKGRLIFRAWAEDQGVTSARVIKAIQKTNERVLEIKQAGGGRLYKVRGK